MPYYQTDCLKQVSPSSGLFTNHLTLNKIVTPGSEKNDTKSTLPGDNGCLLDTSNCDPCCPLIGFDPSQTTTATTTMVTDELDTDTAPAEDGTEAQSTEPNETEEQEDSGGPIDSSRTCYYCSGGMARASDYCENGNLEQGDDTNENDDDASATSPAEATEDVTSAENGVDNVVDDDDGLSNGNGMSTENGNGNGNEDDEMTPLPMCANCEANARNTRGCVVRHLKSVGKCFR